MYHSLRTQGFDKSLRTVQRVLKKLAEEYESECDTRAQPYGYSRYSSSLPMSSLSGLQAVFLKIAEKELADKVPSNLIRAMTPLFNDANVVLRFGSQYAPEKMWMRSVRICYSSQSNFDPKIIGQLNSLIYECKQPVHFIRNK